MKKSISLITAAVIIAVTFASCCNMTCNTKSITPSDNIITKNISINDFQKIQLKGSLKLIYTNGERSLKITGPDNIIPLVETNVENGVLTINYKNGTNIGFSRKNDLVIYASSKSIREANLSGSGDLIIDSNINADSLSLNLWGSGDVLAINTITCASTFNANVSGSGDIKIATVTAKQARVAVKGSGNIDVNSITAKELHSSLAGSGDIDIKEAMTTDIYNTLRGSGDIKVKAIKTNGISSSIKGSGDINLEGTSDSSILTTQDSGTINAYNLLSNQVVATVGGSGNIRCNATTTLNCNINGSGDIYYNGIPAVTYKGKRAPIKK
ncbi:MAG: head GIN domain-containing protein [Muribaculaceae bacterium]